MLLNSFILFGFIQSLSIIISNFSWSRCRNHAPEKQSCVSFSFQGLKDWKDSKNYIQTAKYHSPEKQESKKKYIESDDKIGKEYNF